MEIKCQVKKIKKAFTSGVIRVDVEIIYDGNRRSELIFFNEEEFTKISRDKFVELLVQEIRKSLKMMFKRNGNKIALKDKIEELENIEFSFKYEE